jgi:hypothetical protein
MGATCTNSLIGATVNWPTLGLRAATSAVSLGGNRVSKTSGDYAGFTTSNCSRCARATVDHGSDFPGGDEQEVDVQNVLLRGGAYVQCNRNTIFI